VFFPVRMILNVNFHNCIMKQKSYKDLYSKRHLVTKPVFTDYILVYHDRTNALEEGTMVFPLLSPVSPSLAGSFQLNPTISFFPLLCIENYLRQNC